MTMRMMTMACECQSGAHGACRCACGAAGQSQKQRQQRERRQHGRACGMAWRCEERQQGGRRIKAGTVLNRPLMMMVGIVALLMAMVGFQSMPQQAAAFHSNDDFVYFALHQPKEVAYVYPVLPAKDFGGDFVHVHRHIKLVPSAPVQGCETFTNNFAVEGQIALVQRGMCSFAEKTFHAQQAGAIAAVIYDNSMEEEWIDMIAEGLDYSVTIPSLFMLGIDGHRILDSLERSGAGMADITIPMNQTFSPLSFRPWASW
ncbi:hypothetical protein PTSG_10730 [Salpingoeca rosetta]|uniref:PA domain-containing protein n=1 Tax=Salpingoeca rosetta (strain ATCC 50818 / BSB-021) TaxID=946362 RepID=F2UQ78_SALR5|nr:uncharacterized protein PTSG_10730 [Salpingoeca rosetta]EGD79746.1 hypothetical protein PTSG_10730 [Salpingoeca rosetta]|eukprot:XP_004988695.1 hypothetical protein PTSG_10730 [Salpingoeca rosetta]